MKNRIEFIRKNRSPKMTQEQLAELCGTTKQTIGRLANGKIPLTTDWMDKLAEALGVEPYELITETPRKLHKDSTIKKAQRMVEVIASVQAGLWAESYEYPASKRYQMHISDDLPDLEYFAVEVKGDSMDLEYPEGTILLCVSPYDMPRPIKDGDHVIVERVRGDEHENTVKILKVDTSNGRAYLVPRSSNPEHQTPISIPWPYVGGRDKKTGIDRIEITGIVVQSYSKGKVRL